LTGSHLTVRVKCFGTVCVLGRYVLVAVGRLDEMARLDGSSGQWSRDGRVVVHVIHMAAAAKIEEDEKGDGKYGESGEDKDTNDCSTASEKANQGRMWVCEVERRYGGHTKRLSSHHWGWE
jgi:hypothetical protein